MKNSQIKNTNPYPGVSHIADSKINPWRAQIYRRDLKWGKNCPTPEAARDAREAKLKELGPIFEQRMTSVSIDQDKINEMDKLIDFEDRITDVAA